PLPTKDSTRRVPPGRAAIGLIAGEKIEEHRRLGEGPSFPSTAARENSTKKLFGFFAIEKMLLIGRAFVSIAGRDRDSVQTKTLHFIEKCDNALRFRRVEQGAVDAYAKPLRLGQFNGVHGLFVNAVLADRGVVHGLVAVQMDRPVEV